MTGSQGEEADKPVGTASPFATNERVYDAGPPANVKESVAKEKGVAVPGDWGAGLGLGDAAVRAMKPRKRERERRVVRMNRICI
jgi:hypothetical protein